MGQRVLSEYLENTVIGTTSDDYTAALTLDARSFMNGTIVIRNTHAANVLTYKIEGYANYAGTQAITDVAAADIAGVTNVVYERAVNKPRGKIVVSVKSKVAATPAGFLIEYIQVS